MKMLVFIGFILLIGCAGPEKKSSPTTDKTLRTKDAPVFLINATPSGDDIDDVEYFIKKTSTTTTYELKYEDHDEEVSLHFDESGKLLEKEQDIKFKSLDPKVKKLIRKHLSTRFEKYKIVETEVRTTEDLKKLIDVEVSHGEKPTGLSELSFTLTGEFVSEEVEDNPQIETLN
jgi:hypothetical protein